MMARLTTSSPGPAVFRISLTRKGKGMPPTSSSTVLPAARARPTLVPVSLQQPSCKTMRTVWLLHLPLPLLFLLLLLALILTAMGDASGTGASHAWGPRAGAGARVLMCGGLPACTPRERQRVPPAS